jgi:hypothetical protein
MCDLVECGIPQTPETIAARIDGIIDAHFYALPREHYPGTCHARRAYRHAFGVTAFHLCKARMIEQAVVIH